MKLSVRNMILIAMFTAITAVSAQIAIPLPFSPVPFTLQVLAVCLAGGILGSKLGALSQIVYLLLGAVGAPVFAKMSGGAGILVGATGGYLLSYPIAAFVIGFIMEKKRDFKTAIMAMLLALVLIYGMGLVQLKYVTGLSWNAAYMAGVAQFIIPDIIKMVMAAVLSLSVSNALQKSNLYVYK